VKLAWDRKKGKWIEDESEFLRRWAEPSIELTIAGSQLLLRKREAKT